MDQVVLETLVQKKSDRSVNGKTRQARRQARQERARQHTAPVCGRCRQSVAVVRWRQFRDRTLHLVWWCCERQVGDPLPKALAPRFGVESYEQATARLVTTRGNADASAE